MREKEPGDVLPMLVPKIEEREFRPKEELSELRDKANGLLPLTVPCPIFSKSPRQPREAGKKISNKRNVVLKKIIPIRKKSGAEKRLVSND
jgi:hypothetical protein